MVSVPTESMENKLKRGIVLTAESAARTAVELNGDPDVCRRFVLLRDLKVQEMLLATALVLSGDYCGATWDEIRKNIQAVLVQIKETRARLGSE